ncbi:MAG: TonB C-terminal domain-containing protein [Campylobacterota bacterium]|nr:TonB C-terminal domain-containing protein [Campylobacterota bacterium]
MIEKFSTYIAGFLAFGIYLLMISLLIFYFNTHDKKKPIHYVQKNEDRIQVALASPQKTIKPKTAKQAVKKKEKATKIDKTKTKKVIKKKVIKKKVIKEKVVKKKVIKKAVKKKDENLSRPKKVNQPKDLFSKISPTKKPKLKLEVTDKPIQTKKSNLIKVSDKPSASTLVSDSLKSKKQSDRGIEESYLAKIQSMLEGWPAQSEYAGEKVNVILYINPTGFFEFKLKTASNNPDFNKGLTEYLEQLQDIGFGRHKGQRTYHLEAEFIAKE